MKTTPLPNTLFDPSNYRHLRRVVFLFSALSTRSTLVLPLLEKVGSKRSKLDALWVRSNQAASDTELIAVLDDYRKWPIAKLRSMDKVNLAMIATRLGDRKLAESALASMGSLFNLARPLLPKSIEALKYQSINEGLNASFALSRDYSVELGFLKLDVANPFRGRELKPETKVTAAEQNWVEALGNQLLPAATGKLGLSGEAGLPFDRLTVTDLPSKALARVEGGATSAAQPLVTVVVSAFQPNEHLLVSVKSILAQSYGNLEVLVIDDASGAEYDAVLEQAKKLDPRVTVLRQQKNGGTYRIRNRALDEAKGELVTFHDSDDWMHPLRIQLQVEHLLSHPNLMSNISVSTRLTEKLEAVESNRHLRIGLCEPSLMFRRELVKAKIGYFDSVRKGGDVEYRRRIDKAFGQRTSVVHPWFCLTLQRTDNGGLTEGELGYRWIAPYRTAHRDCYVLWQKMAARSQDQAHEPALKISNPDIQDAKDRAHYAPRQILLTRAEAVSPRSFELVIAADFGDKAAKAQVLETIKSARAENPNRTVGLLACQSLFPLALNRKFEDEIVELLAAGEVETVYPQDQLTVEHLAVLTPTAFVNSQAAEEFRWSVRETGFVTGLETWQLEASDQEAAITQLLAQIAG